MAKLRNQFYGLILPRGKLLRAAEAKLPTIFKGFARQRPEGPSTELKTWEWPLGEDARTHLFRRCEARHWSVDLFFESSVAMEGIKSILQGPQFKHVHLWLLKGPFDEFSVVYAQVLFLHLVRLLAGEAQDATSIPTIWEYLDRAPICETVPEPPSKAPARQLSTISDALLAVAAERGDNLVVTADAKASAEDYGDDGSHIDRTHQALLTLSQIASAMNPENDKGPPGANMGQLLKLQGFSYKPKDADANEAKLTAHCCGNKLICHEHVRLGSGEAQCVRIHFKLCPTCHKCVVQHCGDHL